MKTRISVLIVLLGGLLILGLFIELPYGIDTYVQVAVIPGLPGILLQIVIIPPIVAALVRKRKL